MYLRTLTLEHFRSYEQLKLSLDPGITLLTGANASGKSNLCEAMYVLAATRSPRAGTDGEMIAWQAPHPVTARLAATAVRRDGTVTVEIFLAARVDDRGTPVLSASGAPRVAKRLRLNGIARRATDVVGQISAVLFTTSDVELITGAPSARRHYLNLTITQIDRAYARALGRYDSATAQRNALLKRVRAGEASRDELGSWDDIMGAAGALIISARAETARELSRAAALHHGRVVKPDTAAAGLELAYRPALGGADLPAVPSAGAVEERLRWAMTAQRSREIGAGATLVGPHRDDLAIRLDGRSAGAYGSRAQHRSIALALRLAEADLLCARTGERPILLLDDVFSELDASRRAATAAVIADAEQAILTIADPAALPSQLPAPVARYVIEQSRLVPADAQS